MSKNKTGGGGSRLNLTRQQLILARKFFLELQDAAEIDKESSIEDQSPQSRGRRK